MTTRKLALGLAACILTVIALLATLNTPHDTRASDQPDPQFRATVSADPHSSHLPVRHSGGATTAPTGYTQ